MLLLTSTTDKLQLTTTSAATVDVHASFSDNAAGVITYGKQNTAISSATTTDIVAVPGASTVRNVKTLHIRNKHASLATDVTVVYDQNGTDFELHKVALLSGEALEYVEGIGFFTFAPAAKLDQLKYVTANSVHATAATFADVTGLQFAVISGRTYTFDCFLQHFGNAATTGAQFAIGGVAMTEMEIGALSTIVNAITAPTISTGFATAINTAVIVQAASSTTRVPTWFNGYFKPSADGTMSIRATSEVSVAAGLTIVKGSWCHVKETTN